MPAERSGPRIGRKGHYACEFCRARKLRCDRQLPCANCTSRGRSCGFESENNPDEIQQSNEHTPIITPTQPTTPYESLLLEVQSLRKIAQELETRISLEMQQRGNHSLQPEPSSLKKAYGPLDALSHTQCPVGNKIAYLERVGLGQSSYEPSSTDEVIVKVDNIRNIHQRPKHTTDSGQVVRCVWFPRYEETKALAEAYISNVGYIAHIMHYPSLADTVDEVYQQLAGQEPKKLGHFVLILAIIANSTYSWVNRGDRDDIFPSSAAAYSQVTLWVKATQDVLNASQQSPPFSIEMVQGIIMLSFIVANMEGFSPRYRSLMSTALWVSRELGLHRWDEPGNVRAEDTIKLEVGRRVWWYLVSTDWLLASRYRIPSEGIYQVHPRHTIVRKPRNINDEDLVTYAEGFEKPLSQPTEMSYFLQRMRLAEVSRSMVDRTAQTGLGKRSYADVVAADIELDKFSNEIPSFFNLKDYHEYSDHLNSTNMTVQSYMLKCHVHMQRCRLHIPYLTMDTDNILYTYSRKSCLMAAREIIRNELQLEKSNHPFVSTRLRFSATLHGVFMASIVLLMDACVNRKDLLGEVRDNELSEAFRILECARSQSLAASSLLESLMQTLGQHGLRTKKPFRAQQQQSEEPTSVASLSSVQPVNPGLCPPLSAVEVPLPEAFIDPTRMYVVTTPNEQEKRSVNDEGHIAQFSELAQNLEGFPNMENFQWENVFSTVDSSFL